MLFGDCLEPIEHCLECRILRGDRDSVFKVDNEVIGTSAERFREPFRPVAWNVEIAAHCRHQRLRVSPTYRSNRRLRLISLVTMERPSSTPMPGLASICVTPVAIPM